MKKIALILCTLLLSISSSAARFDCTPQVIDEDEWAVGPFTVVVQGERGTIYVGDNGTPIETIFRNGDGALYKAIELCEGFNQ